MSCLSPILIDDPSNLYLGGVYPRKIQVPCGHCIGCLRKRQNDWSIRISEQLKQRAVNCFITLTYRDECVPCGIDELSGEIRKSLRKADYQKFLKVLRSSLCRSGFSSPSFFVCGEYGSRTFRPHYHIIVCGANSDMCRHALDYWRDKYGFVLSKDIGVTTSDKQAVGMYVGKYSSKGVFIERSPLMVDFIEKPFCEASHFLGLQYIIDRIEYFSLIAEKSKTYPDFDSWVDDFASNMVYNNGKFLYSLPSYYKDYFFEHLPQGLVMDIFNKTGFDPSKYQISYVVSSFKGRSSSKVKTFVPSFRNQVALSLYRLALAKSCEKFRTDSSTSSEDMSLVSEFYQAELSSKDSFFVGNTRKLDAFYRKSQL